MQTTARFVARFLVGTLSGVLCLLAASQSAFADCDGGSLQAAQWDAYEGSQRGLRCEVIRLENESYEAQCDDPRDSAVAACDAFVDATYGPDVDSETRYVTYEACMTIALHTPGAVR